MRTCMMISMALFLVGFFPSAPNADQLDSLLSAAQQASCGLAKLSSGERAQLSQLLVAFLLAGEPERTARLYCENELGLSSEITVESVRGQFLILDSGSVLRMLDTSGFSAGSTYLADDEVQPGQVLDEDGELEDVLRVYSDVEEALEDE